MGKILIEFFKNCKRYENRRKGLIAVNSDSVYLENLTVLLLEVLKENIELKDRVIFLQKEISNIQNIFEREREDLKQNLTAQIAKHILDVSDNLKRISEAAEKSNDIKAIIEGIEMTNKEIGKVLSSLEIKKLEVIGRVFDPNIHEFGGSREIPELEDNIIIDVIRDGYIFKNKVIRPAIVIVNSKKETTTT